MNAVIAPSDAPRDAPLSERVEAHVPVAQAEQPPLCNRGLVFWGALWRVWGLFLGPALVLLLKVIAEHSRSGQRLARLMQG